ncbi:MAG: hypothetical protein LBG30_04705 [Odoribacteraceae bacterium]|jgi:hypothetical protein|nr:hypothetical protein [Odoribacteraceae bacterium]
MKKIITLAGMLFLLLPLFAQKEEGGPLSEEKRKEFEAQKVAFFTQEMKLTPDEATKFWPLYNEMQDKIREASKPVWGLHEKAADLSDEQARTNIETILQVEESVLKIRGEYYRKIMREISARKVWLMLDAERNFHRQLVKRIGGTPREKR